MQNAGMRICLGALKSTPVYDMYRATLLLPMELTKRQSSDKLVLKMIGEQTHPAHKPIFELATLVEQHPNWEKKKKTPQIVASFNTR